VVFSVPSTLKDLFLYGGMSGEWSRDGDADGARPAGAGDRPPAAVRRRPVSLHGGQQHGPAQRHRQHHRSL